LSHVLALPLAPTKCSRSRGWPRHHGNQPCPRLQIGRGFRTRRSLHLSRGRSRRSRGRVSHSSPLRKLRRGAYAFASRRSRDLHLHRASRRHGVAGFRCWRACFLREAAGRHAGCRAASRQCCTRGPKGAPDRLYSARTSRMVTVRRNRPNARKAARDAHESQPAVCGLLLGGAQDRLHRSSIAASITSTSCAR